MLKRIIKRIRKIYYFLCENVLSERIYLITFFLINNESNRLMKNPGSSFNFKFHDDGYFCYKEADPEAAIAFEEEYVVRLFRSNGMTIDNSIHYGSWCGRDNYLSYQDIVVALKS